MPLTWWYTTGEPLGEGCTQKHCLKKGPYFKDLVLNKDLFGILGPYWVLIYISGSLFSLFWLHSRELSHICRHWFRFTLLANFDFYLCLRINFHTSSFWVLILAASGPYWVLISQKNGSLLGPYLKAWGSFLVLETVHYLEIIETPGFFQGMVYSICSCVPAIFHMSSEHCY